LKKKKFKSERKLVLIGRAKGEFTTRVGWVGNASMSYQKFWPSQNYFHQQGQYPQQQQPQQQQQQSSQGIM
jgi:hypothetical protein